MDRVELKIFYTDNSIKKQRCTVNKWKFQDTMMGEQFITFNATSEVPIDFAVGDFCIFRGETYTLNNVPTATQKARSKERQDAYTYENVKLESFQEELTRCVMLDITPTTGDYVAALGTNYTGSSSFQLFCGEVSANGETLTAVCALAAKMQANLDRMFPANGWKILVDTNTTYKNTAGEDVLVTHTEDKVLSFNNTTVAKALEEVHNTFDLDYCIKGRNIYIGYTLKNLTSDNDDETFTFGYGKGYPTREDQNKALFQIKRIANSQQKIVTRLRALGSTKNMPYRYYNKKYNLSQSLFPTNLQLPDTFEPPSVKAANNALRDSSLRDVKGDTNDAYIDKNDDAEHCAEGIREDCARFDGTDSNLPEIYPTIEEVTYGELRNALVQDQDGKTGLNAFPNYGSSERIDKLLAVGYKDGSNLVDDANKGNGIHPQKGNSKGGTPYGVNIDLTELDFNNNGEDDFTYTDEYYAGPEITLFNVKNVPSGKYVLAPTLGAVFYSYDIKSDEGKVRARIGYIITIKQKDLQTGVTTTIATYISDRGNIYASSDGIVEMELPSLPDVENSSNAKVPEIKVTVLSDITVSFAPVLEVATRHGHPNDPLPTFSFFYQVGKSRLNPNLAYEPEYSWISLDDYVSSSNPFHVFIQDMGFNLQACWTDDTPVVAMKSGRCVGREFEIGKNIEKVTYNGKKGYMLTLNRATDNNLNTYYPSATDPIAEGDYFVLLNISMPDPLIEAAEVRLLRASTEHLADNSETQFTYQPDIDDIYLQRNYDNMVKTGTPEKSIFWRLYAGLKFTFRGIPASEDSPAPLIDIAIEQVSISMGEGMTPKVELKLNDDIQQSTINKLTTAVDRIYNGSIFSSGQGGNGSFGSMSAALLSLLQSEGDKLFISKKRNDAAQGLIRFLQGLRVGNGEYGLDDRGDALLRNVVTGGEQRSADYDAAGQTGYGIVRRTDGKYGLHITDLEVWGRATFSELEVRKLTYAGGNFVFSPAGGTMAHVEELRDGDEISGWRCYFLADDGTTETSNMWHADDQALCETSNVESGVSYAAGNKRYWRRVSGVSAKNVQIYGPNGNAMYDGNKFAWIDLMASDCEEGSDIPAAGDTVCCMGNRTDGTRRNAIVIYTTGDMAPAFIEYQGINSYSLEGCDKTVISPVTGSKFRGKSFEIETEGGSVRVPADRGDWQQGSEYHYYDRVSHGGNLWLCTVAIGQGTYEEPAPGASYWTAQTKTGDGALSISGDGQDVVVPADHAGHPLYCERRIVMSVRLGQEPVVISSAELRADTSSIQDLEDFLWVDDVYDGTVEILLKYSDTINEQSLDMLIEQGDIPVKIGYRESPGATDENIVTAHFHLVKVKDGADGKDGEKGDKGDDGKDAWQVTVTPQVLSIESSASGTVGANELTGAKAAVSVRRGPRDIGIREIRNIRTEHCVAAATADGGIRITKVDDYELEGRRFAYGSGWIMAEVVSETDSSDGASVTQDVRVDFTVSVTVQTAQLKVEQDGIETRVEEISNKTGTLETSVSEIRQTAESISLKVDRTAVSGRNLIPCSYLRMVTSTYGVAQRKVRIYGGRDYTLSVNGHIDSVLKGDGRRLAAFVWIAGEDGVWTWSASAHTDSLEDVTASVTFSLPEDMTGLHEVNTGCFPLMDGGPQYEGTGMMTVNWMQLEEGTVATPWSPSAEDMAVQGNLLPGIDSMVVPQGGASEATEVRLEEGGYTDGSGQVLDVVYGRNGNAAGGSVLDTCVFTGLTVEGDMTYTLSFWARGTGHAVSHLWKDGKDVTAASYAGDGTIRGAGDGYCVTEITSEWRRYMLTWTTRRTGGGDAGVIPLRLDPGSEAWICGIKLEMYGRATEYTLKGVTEKELLATGIDIRHRKITLTADMLEVRNNRGEVTAKVNEDSVLETTDGIFKGTVKADAGYFNNGKFDKGTFMKGVFTDADVTGVIRAIRGNIGNWVFIDKYMGSGTVELNEDGTYKIVTDESQGMNLRDNYIEFINKGNLGGPIFGTDPGSASSPTGSNMSQKAALGAMTMGGTAAIPVLCQLLDTGTYPTDKIGIYFDIRNSTNGRNLAFCGNGNGYLDGFIDGIGYQKETLSTANMRLIISEVRSNRIIVNCTASNCSIALPKMSVMQRILGTGASTPFTFRLMVSADIHSAAFRVEGRNPSINSDDYPLIVRSKNRLSDNFAVNACDALEFILVYDPERTDDISGYTTKYTARVINTYSEV